MIFMSFEGPIYCACSESLILSSSCNSNYSLGLQVEILKHAVPFMKMTVLSHIFRQKSLQNWCLTKYSYPTQYKWKLWKTRREILLKQSKSLYKSSRHFKMILGIVR